ELTNGAMGKAPEAVSDTLPACTQRPDDVADDDLDDLEAMRTCLQAIRREWVCAYSRYDVCDLVFRDPPSLTLFRLFRIV
ncbi:Charged multivesicular body protein 3, partial [Taenia solium]